MRVAWLRCSENHVDGWRGGNLRSCPLQQDLQCRLFRCFPRSVRLHLCGNVKVGQPSCHCKDPVQGEHVFEVCLRGVPGRTRLVSVDLDPRAGDGALGLGRDITNSAQHNGRVLPIVGKRSDRFLLQAGDKLRAVRDRNSLLFYTDKARCLPQRRKHLLLKTHPDHKGDTDLLRMMV